MTKVTGCSNVKIHIANLFIFHVGNGPPPFDEEMEDIDDLELRLLGIDVLDPEFQDVVGKDPDEPWGKNLWLFNIREDPNEGITWKPPMWCCILNKF